MKNRIKSPFRMVSIIAFLFVTLVVMLPYLPIIPTQAKLGLAFTIYIKELEHNGLITVKEIGIEGNKPFITILRSDTQEIAQQDIQDATEVALHTVDMFESMDHLRDDDIDITFQRPIQQKIFLINRPEMPEALTFNGLVYGELTSEVFRGHCTSLVNLAGYQRSNNDEYENSYSVVQAICIAYADSFVDDDAACNIISANAAAGWSGMDRKQAIDLITGYGMTHLAYVGNNDYRYRFIDFIYDEFRRE